MRQNIDADTDRLEFGSGLENTAGNAGAMQHQAQGQSADAGADYQNFHGHQPFRDGSSRTVYGAPATPVHPDGDGRQKQRHQNIIAGERNSEETPGRLVTANDSDVLKLLQHIARRAEAVDGSRAISRPRPEFPFNAGVIGGEPRVPQHDSCDHRKTRDHDFARGAVIGAQAQQGCKRNGHIKSITLIEAKRARRIAKNILEKKRLRRSPTRRQSPRSQLRRVAGRGVAGPHNCSSYPKGLSMD